MLCVERYTKDYIHECRARMEAQVTAYQVLAATGRENAGARKPAFNSALASFEPLFFANLILTLEGCFVHRSRTRELKDGNPLNEVRMPGTSILHNQGVMAVDKTIKYNPLKSILKIEIGQEIKLSESDFNRLLGAFFAELEAKFV